MAHTDWYPRTLPAEYEMYKAIFVNIDEVNKTLKMDVEKKDRLKQMAEAFIAYYENVLLNVVAADALNKGFITMRRGKKGVDPMPVPPSFHLLTLPQGDFVGMEAEMREMRRYMKGLFTWSEDMGDVLRINREHSEPARHDTLSPVLKFLDTELNRVRTRLNKKGNDGTEFQWRIAGETVWQALTVSGEPETVLEIPIPEGTAAKIELRAVFLKKFKHIGVWSPTYNLTVGN